MGVEDLQLLEKIGQQPGEGHQAAGEGRGEGEAAEVEDDG
jgi:hypothetical protein